MSDWLAPLRAALDARSTPIAVFLRDDDAGWADERLDRLLRLCADVELPLDVAVIPAAVTPVCARILRRWRESRATHVRLHQHGLAHDNHECAGRKCEFGVSRTAAQQTADVAEGWHRLREWFGGAVDPIFTPPWNRCTETTAIALRQLGIEVLSRDVTAPRFDLPGLLECPIHLDWFAKRRGDRLAPDVWAREAALVVSRSSSIGLLLHHAVTDDEEFERLEVLLRVMVAHPTCAPCSLLDAARGLPARERSHEPASPAEASC